MLRKFLIRHLAIYFMLTASFFGALMGAFAKILSQDLPSVEVVFFRNFLGLIFIAYFLIKKPPTKCGGKFWLLLVRGFAGSISMVAFFYNIANMGLAEAFTFSKTAPIFLVLLVAVIFGEKVKINGWIAVFVGFLGIICIIQPQLGFKTTDAMGLVNGFFAAVSYTSMRELHKYYDTRLIVLWFLIIASALPFAMLLVGEFCEIPLKFAFLFPKFSMPNVSNWLFIFLLGIAGLLYQNYLTKAYSAARKASSIAVVSYTDVLFSLIIGIFMGDNLPNFVAFLGIILVISSGILVTIKK